MQNQFFCVESQPARKLPATGQAGIRLFMPCEMTTRQQRVLARGGQDSRRWWQGWMKKGAGSHLPHPLLLFAA